jgi:hypothetical protein
MCDAVGSGLACAMQLEASDWSMRNYCLRNERKELVAFVLHSHSFCSFSSIELSSFRTFYLTDANPFVLGPESDRKNRTCWG